MITLFNPRTCKFPSNSGQITTLCLNDIISKDGDKNKLFSILVIVKFELHDIVHLSILHIAWHFSHNEDGDEDVSDDD